MDLKRIFVTGVEPVSKQIFDMYEYISLIMSGENFRILTIALSLALPSLGSSFLKRLASWT